MVFAFGCVQLVALLVSNWLWHEKNDGGNWLAREFWRKIVSVERL
jgi:hypothetical protein